MNVTTRTEGRITSTYLTDEHRQRRIDVAGLEDGRTLVNISDRWMPGADVADDREYVFLDAAKAQAFADLMATEADVLAAFDRHVARARRALRQF